ncbi:hypothetical protein CK203_114286 [Vitis vinifera]|uniref:Uncharacterized protein n=1 Tax=Vitis vinifera TaxID=29760 RepID=A0A438C573_VITVI|nr:hypothetical protein CK203_114286 [Vitis vinifera]
MCCVNLRFSVPYAINIFKIFQVGILGWDWDPYNIMGDLSWMKVICFLLLLGFSFISIEGPPTPSINPRYVRLRLSVEYFSIPMAISLIASLIVPRTLFWYIFYPMIMLQPCCSPWLLNLQVCLHAMASRVPGCIFIITATAPPSQLADASQVIEGYPGADDPGSEGSEHGDLEANPADHHVVMIT